MIETRILDTSNSDNGYILQLRFDRKDIALHPAQLVADVRKSLADKIAGLLFEKIEPSILEILRKEDSV